MNDRPTARIAFIGIGEHATESLYPNIPFIPEFDLAALVYRRNRGNAEYWAAKYGVANCFTSVEQMLDEINPDACCICGSPEMHHQVGLAVLERGIPIFIEKPPGLTLKAALALEAAANKYNTWGQVGFMKRFAPANILAKEYMGSSDFGSLSSVTLMHGCGPYESDEKMLYFNGIHMIDLARFFGGDIKTLTAYRAGGGSGNYGVAVSGLYKNGGVFQLNQNSGQTWEDCFEAVYATGSRSGIFIEGSAEVEIMSPAQKFTSGEGVRTFGFRSRHTVSGNIAFWWAGGHYQRGYWGELSLFAKSVLGETNPVPTLSDGVKAHRIIDAILRSIKTGKPVELDLVDD